MNIVVLDMLALKSFYFSFNTFNFLTLNKYHKGTHFFYLFICLFIYLFIYL
jgi:hypothetical protein